MPTKHSPNKSEALTRNTTYSDVGMKTMCLELAQLLRALATLPENWGSTTSTHKVAYNHNSSSRTSDTNVKHPVLKEFLAKCSEARALLQI